MIGGHVLTSLTFEVEDWRLFDGFNSGGLVIHPCNKRIDSVFVSDFVIEGKVWPGVRAAMPEDLSNLLEGFEVLHIEQKYHRYLKVTGSDDDLMLLRLSWNPTWGTLV